MSALLTTQEPAERERVGELSFGLSEREVKYQSEKQKILLVSSVNRKIAGKKNFFYEFKGWGWGGEGEAKYVWASAFKFELREFQIELT